MVLRQMIFLTSTRMFSVVRTTNSWHKHAYLAEANEMLKEVEDGEKLADELLDKSTEYENNLKK